MASPGIPLQELLKNSVLGSTRRFHFFKEKDFNELDFKELDIHGYCDGLATEWFSVLDYKQWRLYEILVKPPAHVIAHGMAPGVGLVAADAVPLLHRCASLGFKDVGVSCLNRLLRLVPAWTFKQQPKLLIEKVFALVSWLLPKHTDWELLCNLREPKAPTKPLIAAGSSLPD